MTEQKQPNLLENFGPVNLKLTDFFFDDKMVKINTFVSKKGMDQEFPVCYEMPKEELSDFILEAEDREATLEANNEFDISPALSTKGNIWDRLLVGKDGDVVSLRVQPLIIKNIYLDLKMEIIDGNRNDPTKGIVNSTILNYHKKQ